MVNAIVLHASLIRIVDGEATIEAPKLVMAVSVPPRTCFSGAAVMVPAKVWPVPYHIDVYKVLPGYLAEKCGASV